MQAALRRLLPAFFAVAVPAASDESGQDAWLQTAHWQDVQGASTTAEVDDENYHTQLLQMNLQPPGKTLVVDALAEVKPSDESSLLETGNAMMKMRTSKSGKTSVKAESGTSKETAGEGPSDGPSDGPSGVEAEQPEIELEKPGIELGFPNLRLEDVNQEEFKSSLKEEFVKDGLPEADVEQMTIVLRAGGTDGVALLERRDDGTGVVVEIHAPAEVVEEAAEVVEEAAEEVLGEAPAEVKVACNAAIDCSGHGTTEDADKSDGCECTCSDGYAGRVDHPLVAPLGGADCVMPISVWTQGGPDVPGKCVAETKLEGVGALSKNNKVVDKKNAAFDEDAKTRVMEDDMDRTAACYKACLAEAASTGTQGCCLINYLRKPARCQYGTNAIDTSLSQGGINGDLLWAFNIADA